MNINYKEAQFEFFPHAVNTTDEINRPHFLAARLTLSVENLVILSIVSIMVILFAFSLGVERGRNLALRFTGQSVSDVKVVASDDKAVADMMVTTKADKKTVEAKSVVPKPEKSKTILSAPAETPKDSGLLDKVLAGFPAKKKAPVVSADAPVQAKVVGAYTVQVASYKTNNRAEQEAAALIKKGFSDVFVVPKGKYVILCIGNFQKKEEADFFSEKKLKSRYKDLIVRSM
jgi:hypothetical protein